MIPHLHDAVDDVTRQLRNAYFCHGNITPRAFCAQLIHFGSRCVIVIEYQPYFSQTSSPKRTRRRVCSTSMCISASSALKAPNSAKGFPPGSILHSSNVNYDFTLDCPRAEAFHEHLQTPLRQSYGPHTVMDAAFEGDEESYALTLTFYAVAHTLTLAYTHTHAR